MPANKLLFVLLLMPHLAYSQLEKQISFKQLSVEQGLSQNSVVSIAQDSIGYLWFATQDGLNRYNGKNFKHYNLQFEDITKENYSKLGRVYFDNNNLLHTITKGGILRRWDEETQNFKRYLNINNVSIMLQDSKLHNWVGTYDNGLYKVSSNDTLKIFRDEDAVRSVYDMMEIDNSMIIACSGAVISVSRKSNIYSEIPVETDSQRVNYSSIALDTSENIWIGSFGSGLFVKKSEENIFRQFEGFDDKNILPSDLNIEDLLIDSKKRLWIATYGNGAWLIDFREETISHFISNEFNPRAIHYNDILCLFEDYTGTIWLGTDGAGLSYYDEHLFKFNSLTNREIPLFAKVDVARAITTDNKGRIWIGTSGKGLTEYNSTEKKYIAYKHSPKLNNSLPSNRVMSLFYDDEKLWIGLQDEGLAILERGEIKKVFNAQSVPPLPANTVWCIFKDSNANFWLGTRDNGLIKFDLKLGVINQYKYDPNNNLSVSDNNIRVITEGNSGELWIGTENRGLNKFLPKEEIFVRYDFPKIAGIKSLYWDQSNLWIGTNGYGLQVMDLISEKMYGYTQEDGLPNNVIYAILPDENNTLWLSSNRGISSFSVAEPGDRASIINYDSYDGLQALEFNTGAAYKDKDGNLYFGGLKGISWFKPSQLKTNPIPPKTTIYKMEIFDETMPLENGRDLKFSENTVSFSFAGLHFTQPERNEYTYFLENYDKSWSKPGINNLAHYTNLPPGDYTFKVKSSNYDSVWNTVPATYEFTINPPWYLSLTAKIAYAIAFLFFLYVIYNYLKWRWKIQHELLMEHEETERLKKLDELKSKLYTNISHEFRTPLTLISGPVNQLLSKADLAPRDKQALKLIEGSSQRMLRLVNQLLELSQLEAGVVALKVIDHDLKVQLEQILEAFTIKANEKGIRLNSEISNFNESWYDKDVMEKIVTNLLSNAIKYAPENSAVNLFASEEKNNVIIEVENENTSLSAHDLNKLFGRFYQADKSAEGVGIGLSLIKELTLLSGGKVSVAKKTEDTISFTVTIPITKASYNKNIIEEGPVEYDFIKGQEASVIFKTKDEDIPLLLIVEDNTEIRKFIVSLFDEKCRILEAVNGLEGIKLATNEVPDLIISDIMMPEKDGIALCNTLKKDVRTSHIPIILLTAKVGEENELKGLQNKADDYITKPFNADILIQKVYNAITSRKELQQRYSQHLYLRPKDIAVSSYDEEFLEEIQQIIDTKITDPEFKTEDFARELNLSRMQLHRKLKALTGLSTTEFIRSQRLKTAASLLRSADLTISEIAYTVGFNTPSYFIKCFKEVYHCTPNEYISSK